MSHIDRNLKSSANFVWSLNAILGKGATGSVYQGSNKHTGELVAVKSFNSVSYSRTVDVQNREYEVLRKVNHENVVKLLAVEEDKETQHKVLIMELCTGGNLLTILDDPVNSFGFEEHEFVLLLKHLTAGMKHLRDLNIIHRDLKPGNIMKCIAEDGQSIYKLADFGAARELAEDQQFLSLYGTEEYLHPEVYFVAVVKRDKRNTKPFSAKVDLWSIGVTLFHISTGSLPFRAYGGRENSQMLHQITTSKQPGIISGIQYSKNGDVEWNSKLPSTCLLSTSFQDLITPVLAGLLEYNPKNMWTFDHFFQETTHILDHQAVHVFCVNNVTEYTFYVMAHEPILHLMVKLSSNEAAQIPIPQQLMIWNKRQVLDSEPMIFAPKDNPIILLNSKATSIKATNLISPKQIKFPDLLNSSPSDLSEQMQHDVRQAKACASIAYCVQRNAVKCLMLCNLINQVPHQVISLIERNIRMLNEKRETCAHLIKSLRDQIEYTFGTAMSLSKCLNKFDYLSSVKANQEINEVRNMFFEEVEKSWKELQPKMIDAKRVESLKERWTHEPQLYHSRISTARAKSDYYCARIKEGWMFLHKNKSSRLTSPGEIQIFRLEKMRIETNCKKLLRLLYEDNHQAINELVEKLDDWYNDAHVALVQSGCLSDELSRLMNCRDRVVTHLDGAIESQREQWQRLINHLMQPSLQQLSLADGTMLKSVADRLAAPITDRAPSRAGGQLSDEQALDDLECLHDQDQLIEEIQNLKETQRMLCASLSENQNLFSELVSITISAKNSADTDNKF